MSRKFLILHGVNGSGPDHWQTFLAERLRHRGETVIYPELSCQEDPIRDIWMDELTEHLSYIPDTEHLTVICHSLSCILWMHHSQDKSLTPIERLILVAPPGPSIVEEFRPTFFPLPMDGERLHASARHILLICSENDPRCPEIASHCYGSALQIETVIMPDRTAHINTASGFGNWSDVANLCLAPGLQKGFISTS